jgi:glutamate carboxypeptidase
MAMIAQGIIAHELPVTLVLIGVVLGIVMALFTLKALDELNIRPSKKITLFINSAEEIQGKASENLIKKLARQSTYVLCLEPALPGGALKVERKGRLVVRLETKGKAAHAGNPQEGINAIDELLLHLRQLKRLTTKQITMNIGLISGGEKANIVADNAWAVLDFRFWKNIQKEKILAFLKQLKPSQAGARIRFSVESLTPPMEKTKASSNLLAKARRIASTLNMELGAGKTGGGSDASIASSLGIPTLDGLGPEGEGIHSEGEHLLLSSFIKRTALLTELLRQL